MVLGRHLHCLLSSCIRTDNGSSPAPGRNSGELVYELRAPRLQHAVLPCCYANGIPAPGRQHRRRRACCTETRASSAMPSGAHRRAPPSHRWFLYRRCGLTPRTMPKRKNWVVRPVRPRFRLARQKRRYCTARRFRRRAASHGCQACCPSIGD
jgi:hypothetical protein